MLQVMKSMGDGRLRLWQVPAPVVRAGHVLIANHASVISAGTEKMVMELARMSLLGKARQRPDQVRRVLEKIRNEGLGPAISAVKAKLDEPGGMGYASAGVVLACGAGVQEFQPGDRVASNGPHAEVVCVPRNLCARVPGDVPFESAAFAVLGSIALQGVRLTRLGIGDTVFVIGLGLIGQLAVALLKSAGCRVLGTDLDPDKCELARVMGADEASPGLTAEHVTARTGGHGADGVLITASTPSNGPIDLAAAAVRKKGRVVLVGVVGLNLDRRPFYFKEAEFVVSCSYGPGRYDAQYEDNGHDYPHAYVRWTEQRNIQAVLDLMGDGRLDVSPLVSHRFGIEDAESAYQLIDEAKEAHVGIILNYEGERAGTLERRIELQPTRLDGRVGVGCIGAGSFARMVLLPAISRSERLHPVAISSAGGLSAAHAGERAGFDAVATDQQAILEDANIQAVFIATRHDQHAAQVVAALRAEKQVFVEKPLCLTVGELEEIEAALHENPSLRLMVGFNRRFSPAAREARAFFAGISQPLTLSIRFNAGYTPPDHWTQDDAVGGGRIIGEACHAIDLATYLADSPPVRVHGECVGGTEAPAIRDDHCALTLRHENGSVSTILYTAGGDKAFPKERVEVFGGGRVAVIEDFRRMTTCVGGKTRRRRGRQDKGHRNGVEAFANALVGDLSWPIPWRQLRAVSLASILAVRSLREGVPFDVR